MIGLLPRSLTVCGKEYKIRTDYRNILTIFESFGDAELDDCEKWQVALDILYYDIPSDTDEAMKQATWFLNCGKSESGQKKTLAKPVFNWVQDEQMIFSAVNNVAKIETRSVEYMHWWTFMSYFQEVGDCLFSHVVSIRDKKNHGKKLDKAEQEFYRKNKELIDLNRVLTPEEKETEEFLKQFI